MYSQWWNHYFRDLSKCEALLSHVSIADCVSNDASLETIALSSNGVPVLTFAGGEMFTYSSRMQSWYVRLSSERLKFNSHSSHLIYFSLLVSIEI